MESELYASRTRRGCMARNSSKSSFWLPAHKAVKGDGRNVDAENRGKNLLTVARGRAQRAARQTISVKFCEACCILQGVERKCPAHVVALRSPRSRMQTLFGCVIGDAGRTHSLLNSLERALWPRTATPLLPWQGLAKQGPNLTNVSTPRYKRSKSNSDRYHFIHQRTTNQRFSDNGAAQNGA